MVILFCDVERQTPKSLRLLILELYQSDRTVQRSFGHSGLRKGWEQEAIRELDVWIERLVNIERGRISITKREF